MKLTAPLLIFGCRAATAWVSSSRPSAAGATRSSPPLYMVGQKPVAVDSVKQPKEKPTPLSPLGVSLRGLEFTLGGRGRALSCWECFRKGVDPLWYFDPYASKEEPNIELLSSSGWTREQIDYQGSDLGRRSMKLLEKMASIEKDVAQLTHVSTSTDGTTKLLLRLADGLEVETVIIPWDERTSSTLCVSSQVGCRQGCTFCATGRMGKLRSLTCDEILAQVYWANKVCRLENIYSVDNIVFMGMGEPADNVKEVVQAAKGMVDANMFALASKRVTISTVGPTPECFAELAEAPVVIAWSVHASRQEVRQALVPTTKYTMEELRTGLLKGIEGRSRALSSTMLEITLLHGVNDSYEDAMHLIEFCKPIEEGTSKLVVNLIPWNNIWAPSGAASLFEQPTPEQAATFQKTLTDNGIRCYIRTTRGDDESAACGQLATKKRKQAP